MVFNPKVLFEVLGQSSLPNKMERQYMEIQMKIVNKSILAAVMLIAQTSMAGELLSFTKSPAYTLQLKVATVGTCNTRIRIDQVRTESQIELKVTSPLVTRVGCFEPEAVVQTVDVRFGNSKDLESKIVVTTTDDKLKLLGVDFN